MSLIPQISNPYLGALIGGVVYGLAVCTATCLPYVASYVAGTGADFRKGVIITAFFSSGRIASYAIIGGLVGLFSGVFRLFVSSSAISPFQVYSSLAFGIVTILIGSYILLKLKLGQTCNSQHVKGIDISKKTGRFGFNFGAFSLGLSRGLIICPPLIALLFYSLPFSSPAGSIGLAVLFGLGTTISPILLLGGLTGWLLNKAPLLRKWISIAGAGILIVLGIGTLINSVVAI